MIKGNKILFLFTILLFLNSPSFSQNDESSKWFFSKENTIKGVAIVLHGLNAWPSTMDFIAQEFNKKGLHVLRGSLMGHRGSLEEMEDVSRDIWYQEVLDSYLDAHKKSLELKVPLYFIGYSMGATLFMDLISTYKEKIEVEKMILFSPALSIQTHLRFFSFIFYLPGSFKLPSRNLKEFRSSDYTTFAAYKALWDSFSHMDFKKKDLPPALIIIDEDDELVSYSGIKYIVEKIPGWELYKVDTTGSRNSGMYHHLTFSDTCYADGVWARIEERMEKFLWP